MRALLIAGLILLVLGVASLFVAVPYKERHKVEAGPISLGVTTTDSRKLPPAVSAILIVAGAGLMVAGARGKR